MMTMMIDHLRPRGPIAHIKFWEGKYVALR